MRWTSIAAMIAISLVATACGGSSSTTSSTTTAAGTTASVAATGTTTGSGTTTAGTTTTTATGTGTTTTAAVPAKKKAKAKAVVAASKPARLVVGTSTAYGKLITDSHGRTLYLFQADKNGTSTCTGSCAKAWPPVITHGAPTVGAGLDAGKAGTTKRGSGALQVTYDGHPLYRFSLDTPGTAKGQNVTANGGLWLILNPDGTPNMAKH